jgi:glycosyltransferase involved in cell wall biosynthesis
MDEDKRVRYLRDVTNRGAQVSRNVGIREAYGEYIALLDSDNEWLPQKLELQMNLFKDRAKNCGVVYAGFQCEYDDGRPPRYIKPNFRGNIYRDSLRHWVADTSTIVVRKDLLVSAGMFDERIRAYQEWDLCIRLARCTEFDFVDETLVIYHIFSHIQTISKDILNNAKGYTDVILVHRDEILEELGKEVLSKHLMNAAGLFIKEGDYSSALLPLENLIPNRPFYWKALVWWFLCRFLPALIPKWSSLKSRLRFITCS